MARRYYEDVEVGQELPPLVKGPITTAHIMRWCAAVENWHRIHYDHPFATRHDGLPDVLVTGRWKEQVLVQLCKDFAGPEGWVWRVRLQQRGMSLPGDTLTAWGRVRAKEVVDGLGVVHLDIGLRDQRGNEVCPGSAVVILPLRGGRPVPYPFVPPPALRGEGGQG